MRCPSCKRPMTPLFTSCVCDYCDGLVQVEYHRGYVVFRGNEDFERLSYVFRTRADAARWRSAYGLQRFPIREVLSEHEIRWCRSTGSVPDLELADHPFELFPDHRFEPGPYRAFLAPQRQRTAA